METPLLTFRELERSLTAADPSVLLVPARILRRVIRLDRHMTTFGWEVPHRKSYVISRDRLFDFATRFELELEVEHTLPEVLILLPRPDEKDLLSRTADDLLRDYWRLLFHARVHRAFDAVMDEGRLTDETVLDRLRRIGSTEYAEIRDVLEREEMLLPPRTDVAIYVEFAAVFLELWYFAPDHLGWWFPAIRDREAILDLLEEDIHHADLHNRTQPQGTRFGAMAVETLALPESPHETDPLDPLSPSPPRYWRLIARAERVGTTGNVVKAAILRTKAARQALPDRVVDSHRLARAELHRLAKRLQQVLKLSDDETAGWAAALIPLLEHVDQGLRAAEARLLYDLQKVCVEFERGVYKLDLLLWLWHFGRVPLRRPLPVLRQVLMTKHLQAAAHKVAAARLSPDARADLSRRLTRAVESSKRALRDQLRPQITEALGGEGLRPSNVPERVAFRKIVEELLDRIVERGHLDFGQLRDTLSQNNLKLPDLTSIWELLTGDLLLRIDQRLARTLDGVYHRGPIYLRASQRLSAMAFGTGFGRTLTRYAALPFGGAYLILESVRHIGHLFVAEQSTATGGTELADKVETAGAVTNTGVGAAAEAVVTTSVPFISPLTVVQVFVIGVFLLLVINNSDFREQVFSVLRRMGQWFWKLVYEWPLAMLRWPIVRAVFDSPLYVVFLHYLFKPLVVTTLIMLPLETRFGMVTWVTWSIAFLVINLLVNSPLGRYADEVITEHLLRGWRELQLRVFAATLRAILDLFQWVLQTIERVMYTVDEWLRFRSGESWPTLAVKAVLGVVWSVITYVVRIYVTLLIEPQVNPIKHFPVVTVSHKMMLPFSLHLTRILATPLAPLGGFWSKAIAGTTVFLMPGVFGFLVWELKENWRLYGANRAKNLRPIVIGSHGETLLRYLRLGFHSGTVPKLFARLRLAARQATRSGHGNTVLQLRDSLHHVEERIRLFVQRELFAILEESADWAPIPLVVDRVEMATHRVAIAIAQQDRPEAPFRLEFQERMGWILASVTDRGWTAGLPESQQAVFSRALTGLLKDAGVDILWQDLIGFIGLPSDWYDVCPDGVLLWPQPHRHSAVLYQLRETGTASPWPAPIRTTVEPSALERPEMQFSARPVAWTDWVSSWPPRDAPGGTNQASPP